MMMISSVITNPKESRSTQTDDELHLLPKENNLTPEQGTNIEKRKTLEPTRKSKRLPFAKQTEKLGGVPYQTNNNKKKTVNNRNVLQEKTTTTTDQSEKKNDRTIRESNEEIRAIRHNGLKKQTFTGPLRRGGGEHAGIMTSTVDLAHTVTYGLEQRDSVVYQQNSNCCHFLLPY